MYQQFAAWPLSYIDIGYVFSGKENVGVDFGPNLARHSIKSLLNNSGYIWNNKNPQLKPR